MGRGPPATAYGQVDFLGQLRWGGERACRVYFVWHDEVIYSFLRGEVGQYPCGGALLGIPRGVGVYVIMRLFTRVCPEDETVFWFV